MQTPAGCRLLLSAFVWSMPRRLSGNVYKNVQVADIPQSEKFWVFSLHQPFLCMDHIFLCTHSTPSILESEH